MGKIRYVDYEITNFNNHIDDGLEEILKANRNTRAFHIGHGYEGHIEYFNGLFREHVYIDGKTAETIDADTLEHLIYEVCYKYGFE